MQNRSLPSSELGTDGARDLAAPPTSASRSSRRIMLQSLATLPIVIGGVPKLAAANDTSQTEPQLALHRAESDDDIVAKAKEARSLLLKSRDAETKSIALYLSRRDEDDLGPMPVLDSAAVDQACLKVLESFDASAHVDPTKAGLLAVVAKRREFHVQHQQDLARWRTAQTARADRLGLTAADAEDEAAREAAHAAMCELTAMPARSVRGIVAKASIFHEPIAFAEDVYDHLDLAISILRDLGCAIERDTETNDVASTA